MPTAFERVYVDAAAYFLPGEPVSNEQMDQYIAPLNKMSDRIKRRILAENGIKQRHYAIDAEGNTRWSNAAMAAEAIRRCLELGQTPLSSVSLLASGSSGGDTLMPGFANMIQGELAAPPMETLSSHGVCASGVSAIQYAAQAVELSGHHRALAVASEMPSRLFKRSRYAARGYDIDFDAHFLRWMLSDGAGALLLTDQPAGKGGLRLRLKWVHQRAFSGDYPVCMQLGMREDRTRSHLDYDSWNAAEADGALALRQDIRLLPHLFDVGIHEYVQLVKDGWLRPEQVDHFLCHYSSERFIPVVEELMAKAGLSIPRERWFSNLAWRGNTGAASIFVMLAELLETRALKPGERIFCYIPESGRFTVAFMMLEVEAADAPISSNRRAMHAATTAFNDTSDLQIAPPHDPAHAPAGLSGLLTELAAIWHDYRSDVWRSPLIRRLRDGRFTVEDYQRWMAQWIPQVREGSKWMREAVASVRAPYQALADLIETHASDEQNDFQILFQDYRQAGGAIDDLDALRRNPGGEALNSYLHALAARPNPVGLLGAIYIIEGTGQRIVPALLPQLKAQLDLPPTAYRFLEYHGENDQNHLARWLRGVEIVLEADPSGQAARAIIDTARRTAQLYRMQFDHLVDE